MQTLQIPLRDFRFLFRANVAGKLPIVANRKHACNATLRRGRSRSAVFTDEKERVDDGGETEAWPSRGVQELC